VYYIVEVRWPDAIFRRFISIYWLTFEVRETLFSYGSAASETEIKLGTQYLDPQNKG
jgi:hypothetical protein